MRAPVPFRRGAPCRSLQEAGLFPSQGRFGPLLRRGRGERVRGCPRRSSRRAASGTEDIRCRSYSGSAPFSSRALLRFSSLTRRCARRKIRATRPKARGLRKTPAGRSSGDREIARGERSGRRAPCEALRSLPREFCFARRRSESLFFVSWRLQNGLCFRTGAVLFIDVSGGVGKMMFHPLEEARELRGRAHRKLLERVGSLMVDRPLGNSEALGHRLTREFLRDEPQDLPLSFAQSPVGRDFGRDVLRPA